MIKKCDHIIGICYIRYEDNYLIHESQKIKSFVNSDDMEYELFCYCPLCGEEVVYDKNN